MSRYLAWILGAVLLVGAAGCTADEPAPETAPTATDAAPDPEETETADPPSPALFAGDDLEKVLLPDDVVHELFPGAADIEAATNLNAGVGETEGQIGYPAMCMPLNWDDWALTVGWRGSRWLTDGELYGSQRAMQFPSAEKAQESLDWYRAAAEECDTFTPREDITDITYTWSLDAHVVRGPVDVSVGTMSTAGGYEGDTSSLRVHGVAGNAVLAIDADPDADAGAVAEGVASALEAAIASLEPESGSGGDSAQGDGPGEIADWTADAGGIGPIRIGYGIDEVLDAVDWMEEPVKGDTYFVSGGADEYWRQDIDGGTVNITMTDNAVRAVQVSASYDYEDPDPDGSGLPSAGGVRIGDPAQAAADAFPGGTVSYQIAPGIEEYTLTDIAGQTMTFTAPGMVDREEMFDGYDLASGVITSIKVEDSTGRTSMYETYIGGAEEAPAEPSATGTETKLVKLDPWHELDEIPTEIEGEVAGCYRDDYRYDRIDCSVSAKCYANDAGDQALCPRFTDQGTEWSLNTIADLDEPYGVSEDPRPMMLELVDGRQCFFTSGAGPFPPEGFNTWSGGCGSNDVLWSTPDEGLYPDFAADVKLYLTPDSDGLLRIATGPEGETPELVGVETIYW